MPIYDFRWQDCGKVSEILVRNVKDRTIRCNGCGSMNMERLMSASIMIKTDVSKPGATCCGSTESCDSPPCSTGDTCHRA